ncbi:TY1 enhancer activator [Candida viswanathii]|uniref:TY1 enhancer activator n=1 Tax=Candida viswanathii TaxID=5486 RepID=A0A367YCC0_9ASCO|nr:TY1 enhancer activator [Candida viswanathii]
MVVDKTSGTNTAIKKRRSTSCNLCRTIKRKCDGNTPCSNCAKRNQDCVYPDVDKRKKRYSIEYISSLENSNQAFQQQLHAILEAKDNPSLLSQKITELVHHTQQSPPPPPTNAQVGSLQPGHGESPDVNHVSPVSDPHPSRSSSMVNNSPPGPANTMVKTNSYYSNPRSQPTSPYTYPRGPPQNGYGPPPPPTPPASHAHAQTHPHLQSHLSGHQIPQQILQQPVQASLLLLLPPLPQSSPSNIQQQPPFGRQTGLLPLYPILFNSKQPTPLATSGFLSNRTPPPQLTLPSATAPALPTLLPQPKQDLDFTPKFYRGPSGKSNMAFGATTVFEADETMVMNANQIQEKLNNPGIRLARLQAIPGLDKGTGSRQIGSNGVKGGYEAIQLVTSPICRSYFDLAFKYFDKPILSYLINKNRTYQLYNEICMNRHNMAKVSEILNTFPTNHFISIELIGAVLAVGASYTGNLDETKKFLSFLEHITFTDNNGNLSFNESSYPKVQGLILCALVELLLGELTTAWQLSGLALRMGLDLGFNNFVKDGPDKEVNELKTLVFWGSYIIDKYAGLIFGRSSMLLLPSDTPMPKHDPLNIKLPHLLELIVFSQPVIASIYQSLPYKDAEDSKRNFLHRYSQLQEYNLRLIDWRQSLPEELYWDTEILKRTVQDPDSDHLLKFAYYLVFLIVNKPFLKLPIGSDIQTFGELVDEIELLLKLVPDSNSLFNIVAYYVVILAIESLIAQISNTNETTFERNLKFLHQLGLLVEGMTRTLNPEVWIISRSVHNKFKGRHKELEELMQKMDLEICQKRQREQQDQLQDQQQQQQQQQQEQAQANAQAQALAEQQQEQEQMSEFQQQKQLISANQPYLKQEDIQQHTPCFAVDSQDYVHNSASMLQNDRFIKMVDTLFESDMTGTPSQQVTQDQLQQAYGNQSFQPNPQDQQVQVQQQLQQPVGIGQSQLLDPTLFNSMLMHESSSTFNSIFSFDTTGFGL